MADETQRKHPIADDIASHAADEPTAVWDANTLREAGLGDLIKKPDEDEGASPPVTPAARSSAPSIVVDETAAGAKVQTANNARAASSGELGWGATLGLAAGLGAAVYLLIRLLK